MTWLRVGDEIGSCPEWLAIEDQAEKAAIAAGVAEDDVAAVTLAATRTAKYVHVVTSMWGALALCDGLVPRSAIRQICALGSLTAEEWHAGAKLLQAAGMWDRRRRAPWRMIVMWRPGDQPLAIDELERKRRGRRRTALLRKDEPQKLDAIARAQGECEYCGKAIDSTSGEIDHVDPAGWNELENLAWVDGGCNKRKGSRTLDEARMSFTKRAIRRREAWKKAT